MVNNRNGYLLTFEGVDGCGKTTQVAQMKKWLLDKGLIEGVNFIFVREPGTSKVSEAIRNILKSKDNDICDETEALLFAASRIQFINDVVKPALDKGMLVVCDRYIDSSLAYQGYGRKLGITHIKQINAIAMRDYMPDKTVFLDLNPTDAFKRKNGPDNDDRIELAGLEFFNTVYKGYKSLLKTDSDRFIVVDANRSKDKIFASLLARLYLDDKFLHVLYKK